MTARILTTVDASVVAFACAEGAAAGASMAEDRGSCWLMQDARRRGVFLMNAFGCTLAEFQGCHATLTVQRRGEGVRRSVRDGGT